MRKPVQWDEYRQMAVTPRARDASGYQRPDPRYCYPYADQGPEVKCTKGIKEAMRRMEEICGY